MRKLFKQLKTWFKDIDKKKILGLAFKLLPFLKNMKGFNRNDIFALLIGAAGTIGVTQFNGVYQEEVKPKLDSIEIVDSTTTIINGVEFSNY